MHGGLGRPRCGDRAGHQPLDGLPLVSRREMRVALYHGERLPPAELLDREEVHPFHRQARGEGVARVVEVEVLDLGLLEPSAAGCAGQRLSIAFMSLCSNPNPDCVSRNSMKNENNPVKHGLVTRAIDWPYSAFHRGMWGAEFSRLIGRSIQAR